MSLERVGFKFILITVATLIASLVLYELVMGDTARETYYEFASVYFDSTILNETYQQGVLESESKAALYESMGANEVLTFEGE